MRTHSGTSLTDGNLDRLAGFLTRELEQPTLAAQIPDGAHIFHGSYDDTTLTQANLQLASKILLGMTLGYVKDAPLMMVFEHKPGKRTAIDLSNETQKDHARTFIEGFLERARRQMVVGINELVAA